MTARMCLIQWILQARRVFWILEQPMSSLMFHHPLLQDFLQKHLVFRTHMHMGSFGGHTPKPTHLWSPRVDIQKFSLPLPQKTWDSLVTKSVSSSGKRQVTGNSQLKKSQSYPKEFGMATVGIWEESPGYKLPDLASITVPCSTWTKAGGKSRTSWIGHADLKEVIQYLSAGGARP